MGRASEKKRMGRRSGIVPRSRRPAAPGPHQTCGRRVQPETNQRDDSVEQYAARDACFTVTEIAGLNNAEEVATDRTRQHMREETRHPYAAEQPVRVGRYALETKKHLPSSRLYPQARHLRNNTNNNPEPKHVGECCNQFSRPDPPENYAERQQRN